MIHQLDFSTTSYSVGFGQIFVLRQEDEEIAG